MQDPTFNCACYLTELWMNMWTRSIWQYMQMDQRHMYVEANIQGAPSIYINIGLAIFSHGRPDNKHFALSAI